MPDHWLSEMTTMSQKPFHKAQGLGSTQTSTLLKLHLGGGEQESRGVFIETCSLQKKKFTLILSFLLLETCYQREVSCVPGHMTSA